MIAFLLAGTLPATAAIGVGLITLPAVLHGGGAALLAGAACALLTGLLLHRGAAELLVAAMCGMIIRCALLVLTVVIERSIGEPQWRWALIAGGAAMAVSLAVESALVYRRLVATKPPARDPSP